MSRLILSLVLCAAPVPRHLFPAAPDPIQPGYRWYYCGLTLEATHVDGEIVTYRCLNDPARKWTTSRGINRQPKEIVRKEASLYGVPPDPRAPWWFDR